MPGLEPGVFRSQSENVNHYTTPRIYDVNGKLIICEEFAPAPESPTFKGRDEWSYLRAFGAGFRFQSGEASLLTFFQIC